MKQTSAGREDAGAEPHSTGRPKLTHELGAAHRWHRSITSCRSGMARKGSPSLHPSECQLGRVVADREVLAGLEEEIAARLGLVRRLRSRLANGRRLENFTRVAFGDNAPNGLNDVHCMKARSWIRRVATCSPSRRRSSRRIASWCPRPSQRNASAGKARVTAVALAIPLDRCLGMFPQPFRAGPRAAACMRATVSMSDRRRGVRGNASPSRLRGAVDLMQRRSADPLATKGPR